MSDGCRGAILEVDLTTGRLERHETPQGLIEGYLGGRGLGVRLLWSLAPGTAADAPETPLIFCPGLLNPYPSPSTPRSTVVTKSPLTRPLSPRFPGSSTLSYANLGGSFGTELKYAGLDALVIRGQAAAPTLLVIDGERARLEDASDLWGLESPQADEALRRRLGAPPAGFQTVYIGPAGERGVRFASIIHEVSRAFARGGVGYVMGQKRLKAIAVRGRPEGMPGVADVRAYRRAVEALRRHFADQRASWAYRNRRRVGSLVSFGWATSSQGFAVRNFSRGTWDEFRDYHERAARLFVHHHACFACPMACRKTARVTEGPTAGTYREAAHFEHAALLGANCGLSDERIIPKLAERCNELGLDIISCGNILGFLMDAGGRGLLPEGFLEDLELGWGDWRAMLELIERIGARRGVGDTLAEGLARLAPSLGPRAEAIAFQGKGQEYAGWNPKGVASLALSYALASRGACHLFGQYSAGQFRQALLDSTGGCYFARRTTSYPLLAQLVSAVVGRDYDERGLLTVGERAVNLERCFNGREGFGWSDDRRVPAALGGEPLPASPASAASSTDDDTAAESTGPAFSEAWFDRALSTSYQRLGWERETGLPSRRTLLRLGLGFTLEGDDGEGT